MYRCFTADTSLKSKKTLSWEQKQACRVAEVKAEIAKIEMMVSLAIT